MSIRSRAGRKPLSTHYGAIVGLRITLCADNGFYSQAAELRARGLPPNAASLRSLPLSEGSTALVVPKGMARHGLKGGWSVTDALESVKWAYAFIAAWQLGRTSWRQSSCLASRRPRKPSVRSHRGPPSGSWAS